MWWKPLHFSGFGETFLCRDCERSFQEGYPLYFIRETAVGLDATSKAPTKHKELFRAARTLPGKGISDEDQIVPTLLAAEAIDQGIQKWVERKELGTSGVWYGKSDGSQPAFRLEKIGKQLRRSRSSSP